MDGRDKVVFIDRDGTINVDTGYLSRPEELSLITGVGEAIAELAKCGYYVVVVTNQSGVARGICTVETVNHINQRVVALLEEVGATVSGVYVCPHHSSGVVEEYTLDCECRKPRPGLALRAVADLGLMPDWGSCWVVGDKLSDVAMAALLGCRAVLVLTGCGRSEASRGPLPANIAVCDDLRAAARHILDLS